MANVVFGNWSIDAIYRARTATPVNVITGLSLFGVFRTARPDLIPGVPLYLNDPTAPGGRRINPAAFASPPVGRQGTLGRNSLRGFSLSQVDFSLRRQFDVTERVNLQLKAEFFNILNHPNFADPNPVRNTSTFGRSTQMLGRSLGSAGLSGGTNPLFQIGGPRSIQFALRLGF
jgi:hypothetical protein